MLREGDNMMDVKRNNRRAALKVLHEQGSMSRKKLAERIRLTSAAITKIAGEMISEGLLFDAGTVPSGGAGRREILLELNTRAYCALGMLINIGKISLSAVWLDGTVIFSQDMEIAHKAPADETIREYCEKLLALAEEHRLPRESILGIGIAIRGITDIKGSIVHNSFGTLDKRDYPIKARAEEYTGLPVVLANNVRALFSAQMFLSRETNMDSQFFLRCEYGIGAALSINDEIWYGGTGQCAEIGHIPVVRRGGKPCVCGKSGCLETIASSTAIRSEAAEILSEETTPLLWQIYKSKKGNFDIYDVLDSARDGDVGTAQIVDRAVTALCNALKTVIYVVDPDKIVLYGHLFENDYYLSRLLTEMKEGVDAGHTVIIEKSKFNQKLECCAAPLLAVESFFTNGGMF